MAKVNRLSSTPPAPYPAAGKVTGQSGIQALSQSIMKALGRDPPGAAEQRVSKEKLVDELGRISWTAEKQARLIDSLERLVDQLQYDHYEERKAVERSQKSMLNRQDQFLSELMVDYEAALAKVTAERDEARQTVAQLMAQLGELTPRSRVESKLAASGPPPPRSSGGAESDLDLDLDSLLDPDSRPTPALPMVASQPPPSPEPTTPEPQPAAASEHRSPLAIALASTRPPSQSKPPSGQLGLSSSVDSGTPEESLATPRTPSQPPAKPEVDEGPSK